MFHVFLIAKTTKQNLKRKAKHASKTHFNSLKAEQNRCFFSITEAIRSCNPKKGQKGTFCCAVQKLLKKGDILLRTN